MKGDIGNEYEKLKFFSYDYKKEFGFGFVVFEVLNEEGLDEIFKIINEV